MGQDFIPEHEFITTAKVRNYLDGALMHDLRVPFGYWEAKDENDDLDAEIEKKFRRGYPNTNIIFEDSTQAVLFQNGVEVITAPAYVVPYAIAVNTLRKTLAQLTAAERWPWDPDMKVARMDRTVPRLLAVLPPDEAARWRADLDAEALRLDAAEADAA